MTKLLSLSFVALVSASLGACSKKGSECEQVFDHTLSLMPAEFKDKAAEGKDKAIAKCEKMSPEARKCALDAASMEDLMKCPRS
jgi:hypothetical protein